MTEGSEADLIGYTPPLSLWSLVEQHVDVHERDEIKSMLGAGVVDETLELHNELQAFLEIWRDCRQNSTMVLFNAVLKEICQIVELSSMLIIENTYQ